jgi:Queuosine biosynthesis protein QueC
MTARSAPIRRFAFTEARLPGWERLTEDDFLDDPRRITSAAAMSPRPAPDWARDLLEIARAAFLVDKRFRRETAPDRWTRRIELLVQLRAPTAWNEAACRRIDALLGTLTGDQWQVSVHAGARPEQPDLGLGLPRPVSAVALLSGGLDSACHAARLARASREGTLLFVSCVDRERGPQGRVLAAIRRIDATVLNRHVDQRPRKGADEKELELSTRTRGFLYTAAAVHAAAAHGVRRVDVPENGQLAVNPPLTPSRLGALSTRSVHPWTLHQFNQLITTVGGDVELVNPLLHLTKGEVCARGLEAGLTELDLFATVSCGRHTYLGDRNCGSCFPCLVRRSGLLDAIGEDRSGYEHEQIGGNEAADLLAVRSWLNRDFGERDLIADMPWPPETTPASVLPVLQRGRAELTSMVARLATTVRT